MNELTDTKLGMVVQLKVDYETAISRTVDALKVEGYGILTEIDIKETFKKKLGVDFPAYKILGACNPSLSHRALTAAPEVGLLLPCNVTVRTLENGETEVALIDPIVMMSVVDNPAVESVAAEARERLERVAKSLKN